VLWVAAAPPGDSECGCEGQWPVRAVLGYLPLLDIEGADLGAPMNLSTPERPGPFHGPGRVPSVSWRGSKSKSVPTPSFFSKQFSVADRHDTPQSPTQNMVYCED